MQSRTQRGWQIFGGLLIIAAAAALITKPADLFYWLALVAAVAAVYCALVMILRALGVISTDRSIRPVRKRQLGGVFAAMIVCIGLTTTATSAVVAATNPIPRANPKADGCNGSVELCMQRLNQIVWAGSHNSMSSSAYNFFGAEHTLSIPDQLNQGVDALLLDVYYGYEQDGIVRTNLAGAVDPQQILQEYGKDAVAELDRLGALTGVADTSGKKKDIYLCHDRCELGAVKAVPVFKQIRQYLEAQPDQRADPRLRGLRAAGGLEEGARRGGIVRPCLHGRHEQAVTHAA